MFSVTILGTNGLYPDNLNPTSGYLVNCDNLTFLVDCGSGVFNRLKQIVPPENLSAVIITHYHFDHISDLGVLSYYLQTKNKVLKVYAPCDNSAWQQLILASPYFEFVPIQDRQTLSIGSTKIDFYPMNHPITTYGVSFRCEGKKFAYTSDSNLTDSYKPLLTDSDLAIINCAMLDCDWNITKPLISAFKAGLIAKEYNVKTPIVSHFNPKLSRDDIINEAKSACGKILSACYKEYQL